MVNLGGIVDKETFLSQLGESSYNFFCLLVIMVTLLNMGQGFADEMAELSVNQLKRGFDMQ